MATRVALLSVGCRTNQEEILSLETHLRDRGFAVSDDVSGADIIIFNTCSVTAHTESKVRRQLRGLARDAPRAKIVVTGCMAQQHAGELLRLGNVAWVVGNTYKQDIPRILSEQKPGVFVGAPAAGPLAVSALIGPPRPGGRTRFPVKIQEGCDFRCAYCIVPLLRGPSRCAPAGDIAAACGRAVDAGYKEIVLTGTHIGQYRHPGGGLPELLDQLLRIGGDFRIRLSSLDPRELTADLCSLVGAGGKLCDHLHVSLQSLSKEVLAAMDRPYRRLDAMVERLAAFRAKYPRAGLGADFITGFPGETDDQFAATLERVSAIGFSYAHIFPYSVRPSTPAAGMPGQVSEPLKKNRSELLRAQIETGRARFIAAQKECEQRIIVEQERPVRGVTANYLSVELPAFSASHNSWMNVIIEGSTGGKYCRAHPKPCEAP